MRRQNYKMPRATTLLLALLLTSCSIGPDYKRPIFDMPDLWPWNDTAPAMSANEVRGTADWWTSFDDPVLTGLVEEGLKYNSDLLLAASRVSEARAILRLQDAQLFPELDVQGGATRTSNSRAASLGGISGFSPSSKPFNDYSVAAVLNYEIDLWGRLRRASESARAQLLSVRANRDAVRLAVSSDIATSYFNLRALDAQIGVTKETINSRQEAFNYQKKQYDLGQIDQLTFRQTEAELAAAQAQLPLLEQNQYEQQNALAILLGRSPREIVEMGIARGQSLYKLPAPPVMPKETPAVILTRRPDVQAAEQNLISANADIGVARANYFPTVSISSLLGLQSRETGNVFSSAARNWQIGAAAAAPLVDFGRTSANVEATEARRDQAMINYEQTARVAIGDVLNAMNAQKTNDERIESQRKQVTARNDTLRVANVRYDEGYSSYLEVLDAQRFLYQAQLEDINAKLDRLVASVNLYKALGGGWPAAGTVGQPETMHKTGEAQLKNSQIAKEKGKRK